MSETLEGLTQAFIGESQARNRYNIYAKIAKKEGYIQIADIFNVTADNERVHAKNFFRCIQDVAQKAGIKASEITVDALAPLVHGTTAENLQAAIEGETYEHTKMYPEIADTAENEGFKEVAAQVRAIAQAEVHHAERYQKLLKEVEAGTVFKKDHNVEWVCQECGYLHESAEPPETCPSCFHPRDYFAVKCETY